MGLSDGASEGQLVNAGRITQGRRVFGWPVEAGDYWRDTKTGKWYAATPLSRDHLAGLANHQIVEHEDGTISVSPSILAEGQEGRWHGYLERGVWREV